MTEQYLAADEFTQPVESYRSASLHGDPLLYPGERPAHSYITDGDMVTSVASETVDGGLQCSVHTDSGDIPLNEYLAARNAAPMEDRIPVLAYGANVCPGSLLAKYQKVGRPDALVIPTIYTQLAGYDVVWSAGPGVNGNFIASLYKGPETAMTTVQVGINFLTREQLLVLHATELAYDLEQIDIPVAGMVLPVYFYAGKDEVFIEDNQPVAIDTIPAEGRRIPAASTTAMLTKVLGDSTIMTELRSEQLGLPTGDLSPRQYVEYVKSLKKKPDDQAPRGDLRQRFRHALVAQGMSRLIDTTTAKVVSWANPSTLPTYSEWLQGSNDGTRYVLPSSELAIANWPDSAARDKVLRGLSIHFRR